MITDYKPGDYKGLISLQNSQTPVETGFNWQGHARFMGDKYKIVNKDKEAVPFVQQPAQVDFLYHLSIYLEILILKARKMGFSSTALGIGSNKFLTGQNEKCVSMSFDQSSAQKQLQRAYYYIKSYENTKSQELGKEFKVPFKNNSKNELVWEGKMPNDIGGYDYFQNALRVGTAGVDSFGRGDDITFLHLTEVSLAKDIPALLAGVGEACVRGAHKVLETTANGYNSYKQTWDDAIRLINNFAALFYSPLWEYSQEQVDAAYKRLGRLGPQEFPMSPQMAFLTSGDGYFDTDATRWYLERAEQAVMV